MPHLSDLCHITSKCHQSIFVQGLPGRRSPSTIHSTGRGRLNWVAIRRITRMRRAPRVISYRMTSTSYGGSNSSSSSRVNRESRAERHEASAACLPVCEAQRSLARDKFRRRRDYNVLTVPAVEWTKWDPLAEPCVTHSLTRVSE